MKYTDQNPPIVCMMTQSTCYKGTTQGIPVGILWHDTAAGNPWLSRYVQPDDNAPNKNELLQIIGVNKNKNDFNHIQRYAGLNCWVGKLANGKIATVQSMPWTYRPWGCGSGSKGSCNGTTGGPFWIQFEIQDDAWSNADKDYTKGSADYFKEVYKEACEITAYLCKKFNIDPNGTVDYKGMKVPTILCHQDAHKLGLGSGHKDVNMWFSKYGKSMATARADVANLLKESQPAPAPVPAPPTAGFKVGDLVTIKSGAKYYSGKEIPAWVFTKAWYISSVKVDRIVLGKSEDGKANLVSAFQPEDLQLKETVPTFQPYVIRVVANALNVRKGPSTDFSVTTIIHKGEVYTIVEEKDGWGKLKSGAGWIMLRYTEKK